MTYLVGNFSLCVAILVAIGTLLASLRAVVAPSEVLLRTSRRGLVALAGIFVVASVALLVAEVQSDFRLAYVASHTERALPIGYKIAAFWAGQEGSLLLWGLFLALMGAVFVYHQRRATGTDHVIAAGTLAAVIGFFAALMLFAANPFQTLDVVPADGHGLNPMLQDPGMIAHPPILFTGYAGFTIPFALLIGSLVTGNLGNEWLKIARPWILVSWIFLGAGILLGAQWAYTELGWGGYWAWDPVENASLLPWLTATALLHSSIAQRRHGTLKRWAASMAALTFVLCIFGTYITRSGVVDSVHSFGQSLVGTFFGVFLTITIVASIVLLWIRWRALKDVRAIGSLVTTQGAFLGGNVLLVAMMIITLLGTMFPAITRIFTGNALSVTQSFYNRGVLPLSMLLMALMAISPLLSGGSQVMKKFARNLGLPLVMAAVAVAVLWALRVHSAWALAAGIVGATLAGSIAVDLVTAVRARQKNTHETLGVALLRLLDANHRRYGSHVVHSGIVMIVAGITGSSLYSVKQLVPLSPSQTATVGNYALTLGNLHEVRESNYTAVQANLLIVDPNGHQDLLYPERRFYDKAEEASTQIALRSNWSEDLYVTLAGWEQGGQTATFQVIVNPLVRWIWAGGVVMVLGAIGCLLPRFVRKGQPVEEVEVSPAPASKVARKNRSKKSSKGKRRAAAAFR
jgi:cytochrome c-type biogenesis protein CcmF